MRINGEHLFVYGTLLVPEIMRRVTGRRHFYQTAILHGFARYGVRGKCYPGILRQSGEHVRGILYLNLSPAAWQRLDYYEDHFYVREYVDVELDSGQVCQACTYVIPPTQQQRLTSVEWSPRQFRQRHLQSFLQHLTSRRHG